MAISAGLDSRSVGWMTGGAAAMRDGELSCGFKLAVSVVSFPGSESSLTPAGRLEKNVKTLSHTGPIESLSLILDEVLKRSEAPSFRRFINLAGHFGGGRPRSGRIFKGVGRGEANGPNESERLIEVGVGFAGIADDEVRGEGDVRARCAHARNDVEIVVDAVAAVHR